MIKIIKAFLRQFKDFTVILLIVCALLGLFAGRFKGEGCADSLIILAIVVLNAVFGAALEVRAEKAIGEAAEERPTPFQKRLGEVGQILCVISLCFCILIFLGGLLRGEGAFEMLLLSVSLAVAVIPESLPAIVTIMLSVGVCRLAKNGTLIRRLASAESLGQVQAIFLNLEKTEAVDKNDFRRAGVKLIDKREEKAFHELWEKGVVLGAVGEEEADVKILNAADISCCFKESEGLYKHSDIVFKDISGVFEAVKIGRGIYENLKKALHFLLSCNIGELLCVFLAVAPGLPMPLLGLHLLSVNLITDSLPAIAMGLEPYDKNIMNRRSEGDKCIFKMDFVLRLVFEGAVIGAVSFGAFLFGRAVGGILTGRSMAFSVLCLSQLFHGYNMRNGQYFKNGFLNFSAVLGALAVFVIAGVPAVSCMFGLEALSLKLWADAVILSLFPFVLFEILNLL